MKTKTPPRTNAERQAAYRARKRAQGQVSQAEFCAIARSAAGWIQSAALAGDELAKVLTDDNDYETMRRVKKYFELISTSP